jgi:hypothetical protein
LNLPRVAADPSESGRNNEGRTIMKAKTAKPAKKAAKPAKKAAAKKKK